MIGKTISHYKIIEKLGAGGIPKDRRRIGIPQAKRNLVMIGKVISYYKILAELGCGGMGVVYRCPENYCTR